MRHDSEHGGDNARVVRKIVSELVFSNEAALAADLKRTSASPKATEKSSSATKTDGLSSSSKSNRKVVYNQNAVNHLPQPPFPGMPGEEIPLGVGDMSLAMSFKQYSAGVSILPFSLQ